MLSVICAQLTAVVVGQCGVYRAQSYVQSYAAPVYQQQYYTPQYHYEYFAILVGDRLKTENELAAVAKDRQALLGILGKLEARLETPQFPAPAQAPAPVYAPPPAPLKQVPIPIPPAPVQASPQAPLQLEAPAKSPPVPSPQSPSLPSPAAPTGSTDVPPPPPTPASVLAILSRNCASCHTDPNPKGGFTIFASPGNLAPIDGVTRLLMERKIRTGKMPPPGHPPINTDDYRIVQAWVDASETEIEASLDRYTGVTR